MRRRTIAPGAGGLALLADLHISGIVETRYGEFAPADSLLAAVKGVVKRGAGACLINGDVAWSEGLPTDYDVARELLSPILESRPAAIMPGNHDQRESFAAGLLGLRLAPEQPASKLIEVMDVGAVRIIALDSLLRTDIVGGLIGKEQREWLRGELRSGPSKPTVITVHHPLGDADSSLLDSDRLLRLVADNKQVKAILTAHDHVFANRVVEGVHVISQPAVGFPFAQDGSTAWLETRFDAGGVVLDPVVTAGPALEPLSLRWER